VAVLDSAEKEANVKHMLKVDSHRACNCPYRSTPLKRTSLDRLCSQEEGLDIEWCGRKVQQFGLHRFCSQEEGLDIEWCGLKVQQFGLHV
jgi:hypothetical protein